MLARIVAGRHDLIEHGENPPFLVRLPRRDARSLRQELDDMGASFGVPFCVPMSTKQDPSDWKYIGLILEDVHVYEKARRPRPDERG